MKAMIRRGVAMTEGEEVPQRTKKKWSPEYTSLDSISATGLATTCVSVGFSMGATEWPGKLIIWLTPIVIFFGPTLIARWADKVDRNRGKKDFEEYRDELKKMSEQDGISDELKAKLLAEIEALVLHRSSVIRELSERPPIRAES
ncbi:hypothetical protein [Streptomyces sp. NPDC048489]|uniref:hypothetical protein n=1 Tax=Streptomyces sp. NPDC048489 TaxID=3154504 RepID=UPI003422289F